MRWADLTFRRHGGAPPADCDAGCTPASSDHQADPGTLDLLVVERYRRFTHSARRGLGYTEIDHGPWPLQQGAATIAINTMSRASGLDLPPVPPLVHYASLRDVVAWTRQPAEPRR